MIKSLEEYEKIVHQFEKERKTEKEHEFLEYLKDGRLEKLITIWNSEKDDLIDPLDIAKAREFAWKLKSTRRLILSEFEDLTEDSIQNVESSDILNKRADHLKELIKIRRGDTFMCIKDVISEDGSNTVLYKKDKVYISDIDGCITSEEENTLEEWDLPMYYPDFLTHFKTCESDLKPRELAKIKSGEKFRCIKDYRDDIDNEVMFTSGKIYKSKHSGCLYDGENWDVSFDCMLLSKFQEHFVKI